MDNSKSASGFMPMETCYGTTPNLTPTVEVFTTSEAQDEIYAALVKAQADIAPAIRDSINPYHSSTYADLTAVRAAIQAPFAANGLGVIQGGHTDPQVRTLTHVNSRGEVAERHHLMIYVSTRIIHTSGQWIETTAGCLSPDVGGQALGIIQTYLRRYGLQAMACVPSADTDNEGAELRPQAPAPARKASAPPASRASAPQSPQGWDADGVPVCHFGHAHMKGKKLTEVDPPDAEWYINQMGKSGSDESNPYYQKNRTRAIAVVAWILKNVTAFEAPLTDKAAAMVDRIAKWGSHDLETSL